MSLWTASERHGNKVTSTEIQQPAGLPCLCQCQQRTREKGKKQPICSPRSLPSLLFVWVLSGQRGAACRLVLGFFEARAAMCNSGFLCVCVCVSVQACLNSAEFSYHSSAGPANALGPCLFFHLLRFLSIFSFSMTHTHTNKKAGVTWRKRRRRDYWVAV